MQQLLLTGGFHNFGNKGIIHTLLHEHTRASYTTLPTIEEEAQMGNSDSLKDEDKKYMSDNDFFEDKQLCRFQSHSCLYSSIEKQHMPLH